MTYHACNSLQQIVLYFSFFSENSENKMLCCVASVCENQVTGEISVSRNKEGPHSDNKELTKQLRIITGKKHPQINLQCESEKYEYGHLGSWCIKSTFKLKQNFQKNKVVTGKTLFFVIVQFCTSHSICLNIGF